jgi:hypothetical protein
MGGICVSDSQNCTDYLGVNYTDSDYVYNGTDQFNDTCYNSTQLTEYICTCNDAGCVSNDSYNCPDICSEGACICSNDTGCTSEGLICESNSVYRCSLNTEGCLKKSKVQDCASSNTCSEGACICSNDTGCTSEGLICEGNYHSNCSLNANGCLKKVQLDSCTVGEECTVNNGCVKIPSCTADINCTIFSDDCAYGVCNSSGECEQRLNSSMICRASTGVCDPAESCSNNPDCPTDSFAAMGSSCSENGISGFCVGKTCMHWECFLDSDCNDNQACTVDSCSSGGTCVFTPNNTLCNDGYSCTSDLCTKDGCVNSAIAGSCNDGNVCTDDSCIGRGGNESGCLNVFNTAPCTDGISCTDDSCYSGECVSIPNDALCTSGFKCDQINDCTFENPECSQDSDCIASISKSCSEDSLCESVDMVQCQNPGTANADCVVIGKKTQNCVTCENGCENNACLPLPSYPTDYLSYLKFDTFVQSSSSNMTPDETGRYNISMISGANISEDSQRGNVLSLDGVNASGQFSDPGVFNFSATDSFSFSVWAKLNNNPDNRYILYKISSSRGYQLYLRNGGVWTFSVTDGSRTTSASSTDPNPLNKWVHLVGVYNGSSGRAELYFNGIKTVGTQRNMGSITNSRTLSISNPSWGQNEGLNGTVDDLMVYNRMLSQDEVINIYNTQSKNSVVGSSSLISRIVNWLKSLI